MKKIKTTFKERKKIEEAQRNYQIMWEEIKPFIKERKIIQYSTTGEWEALSSHLKIQPE